MHSDFCSSLETVSIPDSVTSIGNEAFHKCISLKTAEYHLLEKSFQIRIPLPLSLETVSIGDSVTSIGEGHS